MKDYTVIKKIAKDLIKGVPFVEYQRDYALINQVINRKKGLISKIEVELYKSSGVMTLNDVEVLYEFCVELNEAYILDYQIIFKKVKGHTVVIAKLEIGIEKDTDQMPLIDDDGGIDSIEISSGDEVIANITK